MPLALEPSPWYYWRDKLLFIHVFLQPKASHDQIVGVMTCPGVSTQEERCLKVRITAPPIEGRANKHLLKFLAQLFKVPTQRVSLTHGEQGRKKWVCIDTPTDLSILNAHSASQ